MNQQMVAFTGDEHHDECTPAKRYLVVHIYINILCQVNIQAESYGSLRIAPMGSAIEAWPEYRYNLSNHCIYKSDKHQ